MRFIKKGLLLTLLLAVIVIAETYVVVQELLHSRDDDFALDSVEITIPARQVSIAPFIFENSSTTNLSNPLEENLIKNSADSLENIIAQTKSLQKKEQKQPQTTTSVKEESVSNPQISQTVAVVTPTPVAPTDATPEKRGSVMVAIVIDDMGVSQPHTKDIISLAQPMTTAFLTYGAANKTQAEAAQKAGFEVILHTPMMPSVPADLAPITLSPEMGEDRIKTEFNKMLARYDGVGMRGINNHMGSKMTEDAKSLGYVMEILHQRNMYFLDSKTTAKSVGKQVAEQYGVPYIARDVFLDNEDNYGYIMQQLQKTEKIAHMRGYAVAIGHPHTQTYRALKDWTKNLGSRHIKLVHLGDLVREVNKK
jgi:hypothetical protein